MLSADLATYPLGELLQWLDLSRKSGVVEVETGGQAAWFEVHDRRVVAASRPPAAAPGLQALSGWLPSQEPHDLWPEACADRLVDLFLASGGRYVFTDSPHGDVEPPQEDRVPLDLGVGQLALEGLRRLDEWPRLDKQYPSEASRLRSPRPGRGRTPGMQAVVEAAGRGLSLAEARLALGLSRPAMLRRVEALREQKLLEVEGVAGQVDPISGLIDKAQALVRAGQYDEAGLVFNSLLASDPGDRRVRNLLREAEREHVAALYEELSPLAVPVLAVGGDAIAGDAARRMTAADREVAGRVNGRWSVATLALASPLREVETLKSLRKLMRLGLVELR